MRLWRNHYSRPSAGGGDTMRTPIERLIDQANIYRYAAQTAPTPRQAQAAHRLADKAMQQAKEAADAHNR